jgi:hypothetical protein
MTVKTDKDFTSANGGKLSYSQGMYLQRPLPGWVDINKTSDKNWLGCFPEPSGRETRTTK